MHVRAWFAALVAKYNRDQPRAPKGAENGGQWVGGGVPPVRVGAAVLDLGPRDAATFHAAPDAYAADPELATSGPREIIFRDIWTPALGVREFEQALDVGMASLDTIKGLPEAHQRLLTEAKLRVMVSDELPRGLGMPSGVLGCVVGRPSPEHPTPMFLNALYTHTVAVREGIPPATMARDLTLHETGHAVDAALFWRTAPEYVGGAVSATGEMHTLVYQRGRALRKSVQADMVANPDVAPNGAMDDTTHNFAKFYNPTTQGADRATVEAWADSYAYLMGATTIRREPAAEFARRFPRTIATVQRTLHRAGLPTMRKMYHVRPDGARVLGETPEAPLVTNPTWDWLRKFDKDQPRDDAGRWTRGTGWFHGTIFPIESGSAITRGGFTRRLGTDSRAIDDMGTWWTDDPAHARKFGPRVRRANVDYHEVLQNARFLDVTTGFMEQFATPQRAMKYLGRKMTKAEVRQFVMVPSWPETGERAKYMERLREDLRAKGYDGLRWKDTAIDRAPGDTPHTMVVYWGKGGDGRVHTDLHYEDTEQVKRMIEQKFLEKSAAGPWAWLTKAREYKRHPKGDKRGGQFAPKDGAGGAAGATASDGKGKPSPEQTRRARGAGGGFDVAAWSGQSIPDRRKKWDALDPEEQDRQANAATTVKRAVSAVSGVAGAWDGAAEYGAAVQARVKTLVKEGAFHQDTARMIERSAVDFHETLLAARAPVAAARRLAESWFDHMAAQESESIARSLGDHGARHLLQDLDQSLAILKAVPGTHENSAEDRAVLFMAAAFHDAGYLTPPSRIFLDGQHPRWSAQHFNTNLRGLVREALGDGAARHTSDVIMRHYEADVDWENDAVGSAFRVADNLALFQQEKLPGMIRYVPKNKDVLVALHRKEITPEQAREQMVRNIMDQPSIHPGVKQRLTRAAMETSVILPKLTLGMYGGKVEGFGWDGADGGHLTVKMQFAPKHAPVIERVADLGTRPFTKLAEGYGYDEAALGTAMTQGRIVFKKGGKTKIVFNAGRDLTKAAREVFFAGWGRS